MNVPGIRAALERLSVRPEPHLFALAQALLIVGLRACDEWVEDTDGGRRAAEPDVEIKMQMLADILREAGIDLDKKEFLG